MSNEKTDRSATLSCIIGLLIPVAIINAVPSTIFAAFVTMRAWNAWALEAGYHTVCMIHVIGPCIAIRYLSFHRIDGETPKRSDLETVAHTLWRLAVPYLVGLFVLLNVWIIGFFI